MNYSDLQKLHKQAVALRTLLTEPGVLARHHMAYDRAGRECNAAAPEACCWCLLGGIAKVCGLDPDHATYGNTAKQELARLVANACVLVGGAHFGHWDVDKTIYRFNDRQQSEAGVKEVLNLTVAMTGGALLAAV